MGMREFRDHDGRRWAVWDVYPTSAERRQHNAGPAPSGRERRRRFEPRVTVRAEMSRGWLAFESHDGERRRLGPIPATSAGWDAASEDDLREWCAMAQPAASTRRLIE